MKIKYWSTALLTLCLCSAAMAQKSDRYLEKPLPQGWGTDASHDIPGDDNLFGGQIQPVDDQWWKAFGDPMLDSLITTASTQNYSVLSALDRMAMAKANLRIERGSFFPSISNSFIPYSFSSHLICCDTAGCVIFSFSDALVKFMH